MSAEIVVVDTLRGAAIILVAISGIIAFSALPIWLENHPRVYAFLGFLVFLITCFGAGSCYREVQMH